MKNFLIELLRPLDTLIYNHLVKIGGIAQFLETVIPAVLGTVMGNEKSNEAEKANQKSQAQIDAAFENLRSPIEILKEAYGEGGINDPEMIKKIIDVENEIMGPMTDLKKNFADTMAYGEGGLDEISKATTESILERIQELGPEFRAAMEDPTLRALVDEKLANFQQVSANTQATSEDREAAAAEFDKGLIDSLTQAGVSIENIRNAETSSAQEFLDKSSNFSTDSLRNYDLSNLENLSFDQLRNIDLSQSSGFLGDLRGLTDAEVARANRLTEEAQGPLSFETLRTADQAARQAGGALGRQNDSSAIARAALGRESAVQARDDRASDARARAFEMGGIGAKTSLAQEGLRADLESKAAQLGLTKEQLVAQLGMGAEQAALGLDLNNIQLGANIGLGLDKLGLQQQELATNKSLQLGQMQGLFGAQARQDAMAARDEGRAEFRDVFNAASEASVNPSSIFFNEASPAFDLYSGMMGSAPGTIFTDPGQAINVGSAFDVQGSNIMLGGAEVSATQAASANEQAGSYFNTALKSLGDMDFGSMFNKK